jgi:hypothetical protein
MANDAEPYIAAVADACQAAGLIVAQYGSDDIDPRDGTIDIVLRPDADPDEDYRDVRTLGWNEERGWLIGQPKDPHGELTGILYIGASALPDPADVAEQARKVIAGELSGDEQRRLMDPVQWRSQDDEDDFESQLAAYRDDECE